MPSKMRWKILDLDSGARRGLSVRAAAAVRDSTEEVGLVAEVSWQELTNSECFGLLASQHLGRLVLVDDRGPIAFPVNFVRQLHLYPWAPGAKTHYIRIRPSVLTGRRIAVPRDTPWQWWG